MPTLYPILMLLILICIALQYIPDPPDPISRRVLAVLLLVVEVILLVQLILGLVGPVHFGRLQ